MQPDLSHDDRGRVRNVTHPTRLKNILYEYSTITPFAQTPSVALSSFRPRSATMDEEVTVDCAPAQVLRVSALVSSLRHSSASQARDDCVSLETLLADLAVSLRRGESHLRTRAYFAEQYRELYGCTALPSLLSPLLRLSVAGLDQSSLVSEAEPWSRVIEQVGRVAANMIVDHGESVPRHHDLCAARHQPEPPSRWRLPRCPSSGTCSRARAIPIDPQTSCGQSAQPDCRTSQCSPLPLNMS